MQGPIIAVVNRMRNEHQEETSGQLSRRERVLVVDDRGRDVGANKGLASVYQPWDLQLVPERTDAWAFASASLYAPAP